jgi:phosphoserine phosphatase RsbU/P
MRRFALALALIVAACAQRNDPSHELALSLRLPSQMPSDAHLVFRAYAGRMEILFDGQQIYRFEEPEARGHLRTHDVVLPPSAAGSLLLIRFPADEPSPIIGGAPVIVPASAVPAAIVDITTAPLHNDIEHVAVGAVLMIIGLACIAVSRLRVRGNAAALLWFGLFALLYGLRLIMESGLPLVLGVSLISAGYVKSCITYIIPLPAWQMARALLGDGWKSTLRWQVVAFAAFAPIGIISDIVQRRSGTMETANSVLVVIGGINLILNFFLTARSGLRELGVFLGGSIFFLLYALEHNLSTLGVLPWRPWDETLGFVVFVASLGYVAMREFVRGERQRLSIEAELTTAREIQRSILPTAMPALPGLHFEVRYEPASSVAGDLYDFISLDHAGVGLLVADVAGHGVPAALIASMVKIAVSSQSRLADDPAAMLTALNETLRREVRRAFVTATYLHFDVAQRSVAVSNAGHPAPLLLRDGKFRELGTNGILLGRFGTARYESQRTSLVPNDRIVTWTDGIVEARNARAEAFGEERLRDIVQSGGSAGAVIDAVHRWRGRDRDDADDLTIGIIDVTA